MRADIVVVLGVLSCTAVASADPEAKRLFDEGRELLDRGKVDEACRRFAQSHERERAGGTMLNLAECAEREGQLARAWSLYDEAAREYERTNKAAGEKFARGRAVALEAKLAIVIVRVADPDTEGLVVSIGDEEVTPVAKISRFHDPGPVKIAARAPGRVRFEASVDGVAGKKVTVDVPDLRLRAREPAAAAVAPRPAAPRSNPWRAVFWTSLATGAIGGAVWFYGWRQIVDAERNLAALGDRDYYIEQGERGRLLSYVGGGVAVASAVVAGLGLYMSIGRGDPSPAPASSRDRAARLSSPVIAPVIAPSEIGVAMTAGF